MFSRSERLRELLRVEFVGALRGVKDPGLSGFLTVTGLELSVDRKTATVFYSILGSEQQRQSTAKALERASPYLRRVLGKRLTLKVMPQFVFAYDDTPRRASKVEKIFLDIEGERKSGEAP